MMQRIKQIYTGIYILFLLSVFMLFATVQNSSGEKNWFYVFIFIIIILGTFLFSISTKNIILSEENSSTTISSDANEALNEVIDQIIIEKINEEDDEIDIQKIIPLKLNTIERYTEEVLQNMAKNFNIVQGLFYIKAPTEDIFHCYTQYAYYSENKPIEFRTGETLSGQAAKNKVVVSISNIPDHYMTIASGLGQGKPKHLVFVPLKNNDEVVVGLIEYATFEPLSEKQFKALENISKKVADTISKHFKK